MPLTDSFFIIYLLNADDNTIVNGCLFFGMPASHSCVFFAIRINIFLIMKDPLKSFSQLPVSKNAEIERKTTQKPFRRMPKEIKNVIFNTPILRVRILLLLYMILDSGFYSTIDSGFIFSFSMF